tara:strand:- start:134676 stop:134978 length:303 start_codon:yes stop_codon:yes gene_type:complete
MTITTTAMLRSHLNLPDDITDPMLLHKLAVSEEWISNFIGKPFADHDPVPASLTEAALQLAAFWYSQREAATDMRLSAVPFGVIDLLRPYRASVTGHVAS